MGLWAPSFPHSFSTVDRKWKEAGLRRLLATSGRNPSASLDLAAKHFGMEAALIYHFEFWMYLWHDEPWAHQKPSVYMPYAYSNQFLYACSVLWFHDVHDCLSVFSLIFRIQRAQHAFGYTTRQMIRTNDIILQVQHWAADAKPQTRQPKMPCQTLVISIALTDLPEEFASHLSFTGCKYNDFV